MLCYVMLCEFYRTERRARTRVKSGPIKHNAIPSTGSCTARIRCQDVGAAAVHVSLVAADELGLHGMWPCRRHNGAGGSQPPSHLPPSASRAPTEPHKSARGPSILPMRQASRHTMQQGQNTGRCEQVV